MNHQSLSAFIWSVADLLRGDYKQSDYGKVILPFTVLRRLDCVLEPTKDKVLKEHAKLLAKGTTERAMVRLLGKAADPDRKHPLYNTSRYTFARLLDDADNIAPNLIDGSVAEARTAAILDLGLRTGDGRPVTGTGTDCIIVAAPIGGPIQAHCGLHTDLGKALGEIVYGATSEACVR